MGIRETMNEKPMIVTGVTAGIIFLALVLIIIQLWPSGGGSAPKPAAKQWFYTADDGATHFPDEANKVVPFDHEGKPAVIARVYECGGKEFVGHLEKYTPEASRQLEELAAKGDANPRTTMSIAHDGLLVKAPGGGRWVSVRTQEGATVYNAPCPDGGTDHPTAVYPK